MIKLIKTQLDDIRQVITRWFESDEHSGRIYHSNGQISPGIIKDEKSYPPSHYIEGEE